MTAKSISQRKKERIPLTLPFVRDIITIGELYHRIQNTGKGIGWTRWR
ncbi:hypothetical protein HMPREF7545_0888 [Selenomonas noxia ATCC 43541]|nr:hypothetical protein HMPREF7545_0888 [Selenomonas noxia ATCC 43541]